MYTTEIIETIKQKLYEKFYENIELINQLAVFLDELLERAVSSEPDAMAILSPEDLPQRNEWLNIASGPNDLHNNVEWWWCSKRPASLVHKRRWRLRLTRLFLYAVQIQVDLLQLGRKFRTRPRDVDINPPIICSL